VRVEYLSHLTSHISPFALSYLNHRNSDKKRSAAQSLVFVSSNPGPISDLGKSNTTTISKGYTFMRFYNITLLGSLTALVFLGVGTAQTQSFPASFRQPAATSSVPANVAGGFAKFSPDFKIDSVEKAADGAMAHTTATFPLPAISGHPVAVRAISPGIFPQGILFLPIDPQSQPAKAGDFALLGGVSLSYPRDGNLSHLQTSAKTSPGTSLAVFLPTDKMLAEEKSNWRMRQEQKLGKHPTTPNSRYRLSCRYRQPLLNSSIDCFTPPSSHPASRLPLKI
jgi:hypothetical protein